MNININGYNFDVATSTFPGGEEFVQLPPALPLVPGAIIVYSEIRSSKELMQLLLVTDALRRYDKDNTAKFYLDLDYLPYARQDRVCAKGESFSLKVISNLINSLEYDEVTIADCHSEVGLALINNVKHMSQLDCIRDNPVTHNLAQACDVIIAPDAGAAKKAQEVATWYGKRLVQCLKTRVDRDTIAVEVLGDLAGKKALVVDDIADGGGTFLALATALESKRPSELNLFVTHGIFSKGKDILLERYDHVEAYDDWTK